ncbi:T9SS type A sorting domain-containing protein [Gracilimonas mengyeensis]|uniref:Por secretion system C-terminal sorting domain-containing protein n=1 Tax=Gracilimonas mengyeensis TaxID=1302730 RepID=A0A521C706_9BACT|nr:T9SS type A sorting domain-containing protein [Gracilimonas mengyeensis]SMO55163.1 Por secretion system C-terminal sorting domain-containing protein [Gracilimonas mengyeensis]
MTRTYTKLLTTFLVALFAYAGAMAQESGDFRSAASGDWSATATWETYDGSAWTAASAAPAGTENITILAAHSVSIDVAVVITGTLTVDGSGADAGGSLAVTDGSLTVSDGGTYVHARDAGDLPMATWETGSTIEFTGVLADEPDNTDQAFYNVVWNNSGQVSNVSMGWNDYTLAGNLTVLNSNGSQFRLSSAGDEGDPARSITINGNIVVDGENSEFTSTGSGDIFDYNIEVMGDIEVTNGGYFSASRGSGGRAVWTLHGDLTVDNGRIGESDIDKHGQRRTFVFAGTEAQTISGNEVETNSTLYYEIASDANVTVAAGEFPMDSLTVQGELTLEGNLVASGPVVVDGGSITVADGGTYTHNYDAGEVPDATWEVGSTIAFTGILADEPDNIEQDFYNVVWNNDEQVSNISMGWNDYTLAGNLTVLNSNGNQFRLSSAGDEGDPARSITINGNIVVDGENSEFTSTGSGDIFDYNITVMGNIEVTNGGFLSASRGSGGRAVWTLYGDLTVNDGELGESDIDKHGQMRTFVFAADTADGGNTITANEVSYDGDVYFEIADSAGVTLAEGSDFLVEGYVTNHGTFDVADGATLRFSGSEAVYVHAQDGGDVPTATWEEGSTVMFNNIVTSGPGNASQDFYNIVINSPGNVSNNDLGMRNNTIGGDIDIVSTGEARIYFTQPEAFDTLSIDVMGDIHMQSGAFSTNGTGNGASQITVNHYGSITVDDGNFSISRGSGPMVYWYLHEGDFTFNAGKTQNSAPREGSAFIFSGEDSVQTLSVTEDVELDNLPWTVDSLATLDIGDSDFGGMSSIIEVKAGGNLATSHELGFDENLDAQILELSREAGYILNGDIAQATGFNLPLVVNSLTIDNEAGVVQSRGITINESLVLASGVFDNTIGLNFGEEAEIVYEEGSLLIPVEGEELPIPEPPYEVGDTLNYNGSFTAAEVGDTEVDAWLIEGTEGSSFSVVEDAADDDGRALEFMVSHSGSDWYSSQAVNEPINVVEGERYVASVYLKADEAGRLVRFYAGVPESGGWERVRGWETPQLELTTEWEEYSFEFTATAAHEEHGMRLAFEFNNEANDGGTIYIDNTTLVKQMTVSNEVTDNVPTEFALNQNYPNPFNPTTTISYDVPEATNVTLTVFDITGRQVAELVNGRKSAGTHTIEWNATQFATGIYLYRITAGNFTAVRKLTLIK